MRPRFVLEEVTKRGMIESGSIGQNRFRKAQNRMKRAESSDSNISADI
jgi:hypothetical protein